MKRPRQPWNQSRYVDTPQGIVTDALIVFRTREAWLKEYAGAVLEYTTLSRLLSDAIVWLLSARTLTLWLIPTLLFTVSTVQAAAASLVFFVAWQTLGPSLVNRSAIPVLRILGLVPLQALLYIGVLSWLANAGEIPAVIVGLAGFILLRWGVLRAALRPLVKALWRTLYRMPVPDHVLRAIIVRTALRYRITLADFASIEQSILKHLKKN